MLSDSVCLLLKMDFTNQSTCCFKEIFLKESFEEKVKIRDGKFAGKELHRV